MNGQWTIKPNMKDDANTMTSVSTSFFYPTMRKSKLPETISKVKSNTRYKMKEEKAVSQLIRVQEQSKERKPEETMSPRIRIKSSCNAVRSRQGMYSNYASNATIQPRKKDKVTFYRSN